MNYQDVIRDSKFYLPMNLNLGYLLKDTEIVMLMNVINCDTIHEELSVRKLMRYTNRSNNTVQNALKTLRNLKLIEGFKPNYETLKYVFDKLNNAKSIEERKKWCELYQNSIQQSVSETGTVSVSKTGTQIKKIEKEDINKEDLNIYKECNTLNEEKEVETACSEGTFVFEWSSELSMLYQYIKEASTMNEIEQLKKRLSKQIDTFGYPTEYQELIEGLEQQYASKMFELKQKECYTS